MLDTFRGCTTARIDENVHYARKANCGMWLQMCNLYTFGFCGEVDVRVHTSTVIKTIIEIISKILDRYLILGLYVLN